jgi:L-lactate dehydrogenase complex protein LldG
MPSGRERILGRIRRGLADHPELRPEAQRPAVLLDDAVFAPIADLLARFQAECEANRTELHLVTAANEADCLAALLERERANPHAATAGFFFQDAPPLRALAARLPEAESAHLQWTPAEPSGLASVTLCEALVARTGSVLVSSLCGGRAATVLPPTHIVYARIEQLHPEIDAALLAAHTHSPAASLYSLITGPSRTSDIEKMLVLGAHGPKRLAIILRTDA